VSLEAKHGLVDLGRFLTSIGRGDSDHASSYLKTSRYKFSIAISEADFGHVLRFSATSRVTAPRRDTFSEGGK